LSTDVARKYLIFLVLFFLTLFMNMVALSPLVDLVLLLVPLFILMEYLPKLDLAKRTRIFVLSPCLYTLVAELMGAAVHPCLIRVLLYTDAAVLDFAAWPGRRGIPFKEANPLPRRGDRQLLLFFKYIGIAWNIFSTASPCRSYYR